MAFEVFQETGTRNKEFISVTENKTFGLSRAFVNKQGITKNHKAVILYDKEQNKIGLHFSDSDPKIGLTVRMSHPKHGAIIGARSFFDLKNIDTRKYARRYDDFEKNKLRDLGIDKDGYAYVIALKPKSPSISPVEDIVIEDIDDEPINLDDIPF